MEEHQRQDDIMIKVLEERVNMWMESTTEYRKSLCSKIDIVLREVSDIKEAMAKLPCDARKPMWDNLNRQVMAIWGFIGAIIIAIISDWIKGK